MPYLRRLRRKPAQSFCKGWRHTREKRGDCAGRSRPLPRACCWRGWRSGPPLVRDKCVRNQKISAGRHCGAAVSIAGPAGQAGSACGKAVRLAQGGANHWCARGRFIPARAGNRPIARGADCAVPVASFRIGVTIWRLAVAHRDRADGASVGNSPNQWRIMARSSASRPLSWFASKPLPGNGVASQRGTVRRDARRLPQAPGSDAAQARLSRMQACAARCLAGVFTSQRGQPAETASLTGKLASPAGQWRVEILSLGLQQDEQAVLCAVEMALEADVPTKTHF